MSRPSESWRHVPERQLRKRVAPYYWLIPIGFGTGLTAGINLGNHVWNESDQTAGAVAVAAAGLGSLIGLLGMFLGAPVREYWRRWHAGELQRQIDARNAPPPEVLEQRRTAAQAAEQARMDSERKARQEREERHRDPEKRNAWYREREAQHPVGSDEWCALRTQHHLNEIALVTGVRWRKALWADARTAAEKRARSMMTEFREDDRRLIAAAKDEARNRAMNAASRRRGVDGWESAERFAAAWMRTVFTNVRLTRPGADEGIDITADGVVAQVKFMRSKTGRPALQKLLGAAGGAQALFFAHDEAGYSAPAIEWANDNRMALFVYDWAGSVEPANDVAHALVAARDTRRAGHESRDHGRRTFGDALEIVRAWLSSQLPGIPIQDVSDHGEAPIHLTTDRLAVAVCLSPTNAVGTPRLKRLVEAAGERSPVMFASTPKGLSETALAWSEDHNIGVFTYSRSGAVTPLTQRARAIEAAFRLRASS